ncbi:cupin domain-containing protein [Paenibacillus sp. P22]|uniref:cupin domain-containing protein n=2 Tax=Paenibacillus TaxID=44249 RepID=UPI002FC3766C
MTDSILQSPNLTLCADSNEVLNFKRDSHNYITQLFGEQLPAIRTGLFNVHLTKGIIIQPHWHTNVTELVFVISGEVMTSVFDPFTQKLMNCKLKPGQVAVLPKGWFHWIVTLSEKAHILTIFDQPTPDIVYGSDFLRFTPKEIMNLAYCVDEEEYAKAVAPIQQSLILGPPPGCSKVQALQEAPGGHGYGVGHAQPLVQGMPGMYGHGYGGGPMMPEMQGMPGMYGHGYGGGPMMPEMQGMPGMYGHGYGGGPMMPEMQGMPGMYGHGRGSRGSLFSLGALFIKASELRLSTRKLAAAMRKAGWEAGWPEIIRRLGNRDYGSNDTQGKGRRTACRQKGGRRPA